MSSILIAGLHKSGTTGLYTAIRSAMPAGRHFLLFEPRSPDPFLALGRYAPYDSIIAKVLVNRLDDCALRYGDFDRRVMMIRDPRDIVVSRLLFRPMFGMTSYRIDVRELQPFVRALREKERDPASHSVKGLHELADELGISNSDWPQLAQQIRKKVQVIDDEDFFVLGYEDFVDDRLTELNDYLGLSVRNNQATDEGWTGYIQRSMGYGDWRHWFLDEDVEFFGNLFVDYMDRFGYDNWERPTRPWIDPATSSDYVAGPTTDRIIERQQRRRAPWRPGHVQSEYELRQLISMAEDGRAVWAYRLALVYSEYSAFGPDDEKALYWARHAARLGYVKAMSLCATLLRPAADDDRERALEARFWQRESDLLAGRQRTTPIRGSHASARPDSTTASATRTRSRTGKNRGRTNPARDVQRPADGRSRGARAGRPSRSVTARLRRHMQLVLDGRVRDFPRNAALVARRLAVALNRRVVGMAWKARG